MRTLSLAVSISGQLDVPSVQAGRLWFALYSQVLQGHFCWQIVVFEEVSSDRSHNVLDLDQNIVPPVSFRI
jgi:hypothetical protein